MVWELSALRPGFARRAPVNLTLHHAYLVFDAQEKWHMASNPVPLTLEK